MTRHEFNKILPSLPNQPGIYKYLSQKGNIIYIGKAKNIKKRVSSYFSKQRYNSYRTKLLVDKIQAIEFVTVNSEQDALLLEDSLVKQHQPKYNIQLKDDKSYPYICVKNERFPRIFLTRNKIKDGSEYFGPYSSVYAAKTLLALARKLFPLRTCNYNLSKKNIDQGKFKVCLEYHIDNCLGPCEGLQSEESYIQNIQHIKHILKGNLQAVKNHLNEQIARLSEVYNFEKAQIFKDKLDALEKYQSKSTIVSKTIQDVDVFTFKYANGIIFLNYLKIIDGSIVETKTIQSSYEAEEEVYGTSSHS